MAKASEQFRQSDVTTWGIVALVAGAIAVLGANVSALIPQSALAGLHRSRLEAPTLDQLRMQVAELREQTIQLKRESGILAARFALEEQQGNEITRRVGALEVSLPRLLEALPENAQIDRSNVTAAIGEGQALVYDADGGSVMIRQQPMQEAHPVPSQPLPDLPAAGLAMPDDTAFGIAIGPGISVNQAPKTWDDLSRKLGPLLFGLAPLLVDEANGDDKRIVVGPITQLSEATALCVRLERVAVSCMPMPFTGSPLAR